MLQSIHKLLPAAAAVLALGATASAQIAFDPAVDITLNSEPEVTAYGDWDGDGDMDLATTADGPDRVELFFNAGDGTFPTRSSINLASGSSPNGLFAANFDTDNDTDLVVTLKSLDAVQVLFNQGGGTFSLGANEQVGVEPEYVVAAHLNGDVFLDIAVTNRAGNSLSILENDGTGDFGAAHFYASGNDSRGLVAADLDEDDDIDIAVAAHGDDQITTWMNDGTGLFTAGQVLSIPSISPEGVDSADLDNDGDNDILTGGEQSGSHFLSIFIQSAPGTFSGPTHYATNGNDPGFVFAGDFDLDADIDAAIVSESSNDVAVLTNNGNGTFTNPQNFATDTQPGHVIGVDLDGNNSLDLVTTNGTGDSISVLLNQAASGFTELGAALGGTNGLPHLEGVGTLQPNTPASIRVTNGLANATAFLIIGLSRIDASFAGGTMVPSLEFIFLMQLDGDGHLFLQDNWPPGVTPGDDFFFQVWILDPNGPDNFSATNAIQATAP